MPHLKIAVIEDEIDIIRLVKYNLEKEGYEVVSADTGHKAVQLVKTELPDLVLLDLMLPGKDGFTICRELKSGSETAHIPIIMVTAKSDDINVVTGLELGADDYIAKPFNISVLIARIRSVLRRGQQKNEPHDDETLIQVGPLTIHPGKCEIRYSGNVVSLTNSEMKLLLCLARRPGWVFSRQQIIDYTMGEGHVVTDRMVDVMMVAIRKKLGAGAEMISTVRGAGYRLVKP